MRYLPCLSVAVAVAGLAAGHARADVIYSTFGPDDSFDNTTGQTLHYLQFDGATVIDHVAVSFIPSTTEALDQVMVAVEAPDAPFTVSVTENEDFTILGGTDGAGIPLESFNVTGDSAPQLLTLSSVLHPVLTAGTKYWVDVQTSPAWLNTTDMGTWFNNDQNIIGEVSEDIDFCNLPCAPLTENTIAPAVEVTGLVVPEPSMFLPMFGAGLAIGLRTRKRSAGSKSHPGQGCVTL
jgi:hypothetical protein